jgi:hypothetical protein
MQIEIDNSKNTTHRPLRELPGMSPTEILEELPEGDEANGFFVPYEKASSIKTTMSKMKGTHGMVFKSAVTKGGIIVWKESNSINQQTD